MKAICVHAFGGPEVLQFEETQISLPGPSEILLEVKAAGVNPVDTYILTGEYALKPALPFIPGMDGAGVVKRIGKSVKFFHPGDRVYFSGNTLGTYCEELVCSADYVFPLPTELTFEQGAAIGVPFATAYRSLVTKGRAIAGETVLVHGASGGVGIAAVQLAKAAGLKVLATAGSEPGLQLVREQGADAVFDHSRAGHGQEILAATQDRGVDLVIEMLANVNLVEDLKILAANGRIVVVGSRGAVMINPRDLMKRDASICGMVLLNVASEERQKIYQALHKGFVEGKLRPVIGERFALSNAAEAHRAIVQKRAFGKIVLVP